MSRIWTLAISLLVSLLIMGSPIWAQNPGWLGANIADQDHGVRIVEVQNDSPAAKAGLQANDTILEFNGQPVAGVLQLTRLVRETPAGRTVTIKYERNDRTETTQLTTGTLPPAAGGMRIETPSISSFRMPDFGDMRDSMNSMMMNFPDMQGSMAATQFGMRLDSMTSQLREFFGAPAGEGVLVSSVDSRSAAGQAGLKAGDVIVSVNGKRVLSPPDAFREFGGSDAVVLKVIRDRKSQEIRFQAPAADRSRPGSSLQHIPNDREL